MGHDTAEDMPFAITLKSSSRQPSINHLRNLNSDMLLTSAAASCRASICTEIRANRSVPCHLVLKPPSKRPMFRSPQQETPHLTPVLAFSAYILGNKPFTMCKYFLSFSTGAKPSDTTPLDHTSHGIVED